MSTIHLRFFSEFCVSSDDDSTHTPTSKKAIGLLALLATSENGSRKRRWLESKLWSDRGPDQARGSLRTALLTLRRAFGPHVSAIGSDRSSVWLNLDIIKTDLDEAPFGETFLEDPEINDPEFNIWLAQQRAQYANEQAQESVFPEKAHQLSIQCGEPWVNAKSASLNSQLVNTQIGKIVSDFIASSRCTVQHDNADLVIRTTIDETADGATLFAQVIDPTRDEIIHSDHCFTSDVNSFIRDPEQLGRFCWNLADLALEKIPTLYKSQNVLAERSAYVQSALGHVLSFEPNEMLKSLSVLKQASDHLDAGLFLALKAWALTSLIMEGFQEEDAQTLEEITMLLAKAQELAPTEGMVAAVCASVKSALLEDFSGAVILAQRALRENPNNIFALQAMSASRAVEGKMNIAYDLSRHSQTVSSLSKFGAMCNLHHALLCISMQRGTEAIQSSDNAAKLAPHYRAPRRQLLALYAAGDQQPRIQRALSEIRSVEPDFELDRFLFDRSYPSNTLRKSGYLEKAKTRLVNET